MYTDIGRDGMLQGINIEATLRLARAVSIPIIASGGLTNLKDIDDLCAIEDDGVMGVIAGRAIYNGNINLTEAQKSRILSVGFGIVNFLPPPPPSNAEPLGIKNSNWTDP